MEIAEVILVDREDKPIGTAEKMEAHEKGLLHRAFSVFIFNKKGEMLLQQRAQTKYHSAGLWTNACCSHPLPGEATAAAVLRRLNEELGFVTDVKKIFDFTYTASFENGLIENEFDHVFTGTYEGVIDFNKSEVMNISYKSLKEIKRSLQTDPQLYTIWFQIAFPKIEDWWEKEFLRQVA